MAPEFVIYISAAISLVILVVSLNALLTCARELTAIRKHMDRVVPEALLHLKTERRGSAGQPAPKE